MFAVEATVGEVNTLLADVGAEVVGIDLRELGAVTTAAIGEAWIEFGLLVSSTAVVLLLLVGLQADGPVRRGLRAARCDTAC